VLVQYGARRSTFVGTKIVLRCFDVLLAPVRQCWTACGELPAQLGVNQAEVVCKHESLVRGSGMLHKPR